MTAPAACCPSPPHPPRITIAPGMAVLDRQIAGFGEWRQALLQSIGTPGWSAGDWAPGTWPLAGWTADRPDDLGVMLLEFWAYVLDICAFYDARIAERAYLGTAGDASTLGEIVALIGYEPRPALAGSISLALIAGGADAVALPAGTAFRSAAFGAEPPQTFELVSPATIWPQRNRWQLAPFRPDLFDGVLRLRPGEAPQRGAIVALLNAGSAGYAGQVSAVETETNPDGQRYQRLQFADGSGPAALSGVPLSTLAASILPLRAGLSAYASPAFGSSEGTGWVLLDAVYPVLTAGTAAAVEIDGTFAPVVITAVDRVVSMIDFGAGANAVKQPVAASKVSFAWAGTLAGTAIVLHAGARPLAAPTRPAAMARTLGDIRSAPALNRLVPALGQAPGSGAVLAQGQAAAGVALSGTIEPDGNGDGAFVTAGDVVPFAPVLQAPVSLFGNVVTAVRGQTVTGEILGSGDASRAGQSFALSRKPLAWVRDAGSPIGRSPQITIAIDGLIWQWVPGFYGCTPQARVFVVAMAADGTATVRFGDGVHGARLPTGVGNIRADYRYGAGAAAPPPGSTTQIARGAAGLKSVVSPLAGTSGADAESPDAIRMTAPAAMMAMDRAVSPADYLALARLQGGVINAAVSESWNAAALCVGIVILIVASDAQSTSLPADLEQFLRDRSAPGVPVQVVAAKPQVLAQFDIAVTVAPGHVGDTVRARVATALLDPARGLLSPARLVLGAPLFRSVIMAAAFAVPGVAGITITTASGPMGEALVPDAGAWLDILTNGRIL